MKHALLVCGSPEHCAPGYTTSYEQALRSAGVECDVIRPGDHPPDTFSGLVLIGGSDVNPSLYDAARDPYTEGSDDARDALELRLIQDALYRDVPVLAICRGLQILNVQHGGTLIQHLPTTEHHRRKTPDSGLPVHQVEIVPGTKLAEIADGALFWDVNSRHHQAVDRPGFGLRVSALDPSDGVIEAVERPDKRFVIGVQWHPENQAPTDKRQAALFRAFGEAIL
jgi:putative glutamine amidotransferase